MSTYAEFWIRGFAKRHFRQISAKGSEYNPHVTHIRPFVIQATDQSFQDAVIDYCSQRKPFTFYFEGIASFNNGEIRYVPVLGRDFLEFNDGLEKAIEPFVLFNEKLNEQKVLHVHVHPTDPEYSCPKIQQWYFRTTIIRARRIWFSYDHVLQRVLSREDTKNKRLLVESVRQLEPLISNHNTRHLTP